MSCSSRKLGDCIGVVLVFVVQEYDLLELFLLSHVLYKILCHNFNE